MALHIHLNNEPAITVFAAQRYGEVRIEQGIMWGLNLTPAQARELAAALLTEAEKVNAGD